MRNIKNKQKSNLNHKFTPVSYCYIYRRKPEQIVLDDDVLADDGRLAVGGSLHLRLDHLASDTSPSGRGAKEGLVNPVYGSVRGESLS